MQADEETLKQIRVLGQIQCTMEETAAVLLVTKPTLIAFFTRHPEAKAQWSDGQLDGRASLRRWQFEAAQKGNATMQIWLGKQFLGQSDKTELTGKAGGPIETKEANFEQIVRALDGAAAARASGDRRAGGVAQDGKGDSATTH